MSYVLVGNINIIKPGTYVNVDPNGVFFLNLKLGYIRNNRNTVVKYQL